MFPNEYENSVLITRRKDVLFNFFVKLLYIIIVQYYSAVDENIRLKWFDQNCWENFETIRLSE